MVQAIDGDRVKFVHRYESEQRAYGVAKDMVKAGERHVLVLEEKAWVEWDA